MRKIEIVTPGKKPADGFDACVIGKDIKLEPERLISYRLASWQPVVYDALVLCAAVEYCDRRQRRPSEGWGRDFWLRIAVHEPARWMEPAVQTALVEALSRLTGDRWMLEFIQNEQQRQNESQAHFEMPEPNSVMIPFSNGMDSWAVSRLLSEQQMVLVRLGGAKMSRGRRVGAIKPFERVPFRVPDQNFREKTGRARGFKFAMVSGLAAYLSKASRVIISESGQGALGPVMVAHRYGDYRSHPLFLRKMERLLAALLGHSVRYEFPQLWSTKGQTLAKALALSQDDSWRRTRSCWQKPRQISVGKDQPLRHCGYCAACMLRRLSVHAAGLTEAPDNYALEDLSAPTLEDGMASEFRLERLKYSQPAYAVAGSMHLDHLADLHKSASHSAVVARQVRELARARGDTEENLNRDMIRMLAQHETEWRAFLKSLSPRSFIRQRSMVTA